MVRTRLRGGCLALLAALLGVSTPGTIGGPLGVPMECTGSGTSWLPDDSPMHACQLMTGSRRAAALIVHPALPVVRP